MKGVVNLIIVQQVFKSMLYFIKMYQVTVMIEI